MPRIKLHPRTKGISVHRQGRSKPKARPTPKLMERKVGTLKTPRRRIKVHRQGVPKAPRRKR